MTQPDRQLLFRAQVVDLEREYDHAVKRDALLNRDEMRALWSARLAAQGAAIRQLMDNHNALIDLMTGKAGYAMVENADKRWSP